MEYLSVKNWQDFQQYKDREPKWIKLYRSLLMDYKFDNLSDAEFGQLVKIWLLASQLGNKIPNDPSWIQKKTSMSQKPSIDKYIQSGFLVLGGSVNIRTNPYKNVLREEKKREDTDKNDVQGFEEFWKAYPKKLGKGAARKAWKKLNPSSSLLTNILEAIKKQKSCEQWCKDNGQFIPHPATWLNQERWQDEVEVYTVKHGGPVVKDTMDPETKRLIQERYKEKYGNT